MAHLRFQPDGVLLGAGTNRNGWVLRAWDHVDRELVAIKHSPFDQDSANEVAILGLVRHENIIRVKAAYPDGDFEKEPKIALVMELMKGSLEGKRLHRSQIVCVMRQLCSALAYLHDDVGVVHSDIKPSNILFMRLGRAPLVRLGDFGLAQYIKQTSARGTAGYMAPDVKRGRSPTPASDMWSLGVTLVQLCTGTPFDPSSGFSISTSLRQLFCDDALLCDLVDRMLELNPRKRITAAQALRHPFLSSEQVQWDIHLLRKRDARVAAMVRVLPVATASCPAVCISDM